MLDTNICVYILKQRPAVVLKRFDKTRMDQITYNLREFNRVPDLKVENWTLD